MQATAIDNLPALMREWVEWWHEQMSVGFPDATTLYKAIMGDGHGEFKSTIPAGIEALEASGALQRLIDAMRVLTQYDETRTPVQCLQMLYLIGPEQSLEVWGKSKTKFYENIRTGEILIKREMRR